MKCRNWTEAIAAVLLLDGAALHAQAHAPSDRALDPLSIVLAVDTGSSNRVDLSELREALRRFVERLVGNDRAALCSFGESLQCAPFTRDRRVLLDEIEGIRDHDGARMFDSIDEAIGDLREMDGRRVVVVFTMAPDTQRSVNPNAVLAEARSVAATVYAVGLDVRYFDGDEMVDGEPDPELERLVRETGGKYVEVDESDDLPTAFGRLAREIH